MRWLYGLVAGGIAAVVAALVSLPLDSPDDLVFNTATVAIGAMAIGVFEGVLWQALGTRPQGRQLYIGISAGAFVVAAVGIVIGETLLEGTVRFALPLAALIFIITALLPPVLDSLQPARNFALGGAAASLIAALAIGFGLAGMGDEPSGRLELPDPDPTDAPAASSTGTPSETVDALTAEDVAGITYVIAEGSELTYTVREKLASLPASSDAVGRTNTLSGEVTLDGATAINADLSTLESDQDRRDNRVRTIFASDPIAQFVVDNLELPDEYVPGTAYTGTVTGTATVRGVERPLTFEIEARLQGDELQVVARTDFTWDDFQLEPPNFPGIVQVEDNVHIEVLLIALADGAATG
ncbi:MAG: YceI family protein [Dehalococcoidia bacterium]